MEKLTNEEIARVFAMYWGCRLDAGMITKVDSFWMNKVSNGETDTVLLLTPLSKITDEDLVACYHLHSGLIGYDYTCDFKPALEMARHWINMDGEKTLCKLTQLSEYLRSKGYAVPLFFGLNHWANGKTPIELGIAIESL